MLPDLDHTTRQRRFPGHLLVALQLYEPPLPAQRQIELSLHLYHLRLRVHRLDTPQHPGHLHTVQGRRVLRILHPAHAVMCHQLEAGTVLAVGEVGGTNLLQDTCLDLLQPHQHRMDRHLFQLGPEQPHQTGPLLQLPHRLDHSIRLRAHQPNMLVVHDKP